MVVIVDTFTRFIWCCPVANLKAIKVQKAFLSALNRPGNSNANYEFLRDKVKRVVVDGGSEFKSVFPQAVKLYFPNAEIITSNAKNRTGNRPTGNGPIEAAIRLLRLVMRDYSLGISPNFLGTENNIQHFCNFQKQMSEQSQPLSPDVWAQFLISPGNTVQSLMGNYTQQSNQLFVQMQEQMIKAMGLKK